MSALLDRLAAAGADRPGAPEAVDWRAADPSKPWLPRELLALAALGPRADDAALVLRFSRVEFARLCATGLWLEGVFIGRLARHGLHSACPAQARIALREIREEAGHGLMFLDVIERAGLGTGELLGPTRLLTRIATRLDPARVPFWAMTFIGESVTDTFATKALRHGDRICPVARRIMELHHRDEARHIAAARALLAERLPAMTPLGRKAFPVLMHGLLRLFLDAIFYPTPASLRAVGIADSEAAARRARACPARRALVRSCVQPALRSLVRAGLLREAA